MMPLENYEGSIHVTDLGEKDFDQLKALLEAR